MGMQGAIIAPLPPSPPPRGPMFPIWPRKPQTVGFTLFGWLPTRTPDVAAASYENYAQDPVSVCGGGKCGQGWGIVGMFRLRAPPFPSPLLSCHLADILQSTFLAQTLRAQH